MNFTVSERSRIESTGQNATLEINYLISGTISASAWNSGTTYAAGNVVKRSNGTATDEYISVVAGNLNHDPLTSPTYWQPYGEIGALDTLSSASPSSFQGLVRKSRRVEPVRVHAIPDATLTLPQLWYGSALYQQINYSIPATGESLFSFETSGGSQHITQSLETIAKYPAGADDTFGAIGDTGDHVEGVDVTVPVYNFSETHYIAFDTVNQAYRLTLFGLTGKVNTDAFRGFAAGEVLFLGAHGSQRGSEDWEVTFHFAASPNKTSLSIGSGDHEITGIAKNGWEYMWVRYKPAAGTARSHSVPEAVYIERVYDEAKFTGEGGLGID